MNLRSALIIAAAVSPAIAADRESIVREYQDAAMRVRADFENVSLIWSCSQFRLDGTPFHTRHHRVRQNRGRLVAEVFRKVDDSGQPVGLPDQIWIVNHRYAATIEQSKGALVPSPARAADGSRPRILDFEAAFASAEIDHRSYLELFKNPNTEIVSDATVVWRGQSVRRIIVEFGEDHRPNPPLRCRIGLLFRTDLDWACVGIQRFDLPDRDDLPIRESELIVARGPDGRLLYSALNYYSRDREEETFFLAMGGPITSFSRSETAYDANAFTLSALGFPEPEGEFPLDGRFTDPDGMLDPARYPAAVPRTFSLPAWGYAMIAGVVAIAIIWRMTRFRKR
jgi:hypothetical protein